MEYFVYFHDENVCANNQQEKKDMNVYDIRK